MLGLHCTRRKCGSVSGIFLDFRSSSWKHLRMKATTDLHLTVHIVKMGEIRGRYEIIDF